MTSGVKQTVGDIRNGDPQDTYEIRYNPAQDRVFAAGVREQERLPETISYMCEPYSIKIDPADPYNESSIKNQIEFHQNALAGLLAKKALIDSSVLIARGYNRRSAPTMTEVKTLLERQGADIILDTFRAGVPVEYIATSKPFVKGMDICQPI